MTTLLIKTIMYMKTRITKTPMKTTITAKEMVFQFLLEIRGYRFVTFLPLKIPNLRFFRELNFLMGRAV